MTEEQQKPFDYMQLTGEGKKYHDNQSELFQAADEKAKNDEKAKEALEIV